MAVLNGCSGRTSGVSLRQYCKSGAGGVREGETGKGCENQVIQGLLKELNSLKYLWVHVRSAHVNNQLEHKSPEFL